MLPPAYPRRRSRNRAPAAEIRRDVALPMYQHQIWSLGEAEYPEQIERDLAGLG